MEVVTALATSGLMWADNTTNVTTTSTPGDINTTSIGNSTTPIYADTDDPQLSTMFMTFYFSVRGLFSVFAIFGNLLTIVAVVRFEMLQSNTNFLICSLAIADILGGCMTPLNISHYVLSEQPIFIPLCLIDKIFSVISLDTNLLSILWIAIDRYVYIAHGLHYPLLVTRTKTLIIIVLTWLCVIIQVTAVFLLMNRLEMGMPCKFAVFLSQVAFHGLTVPLFPVTTALTIGFHIAIAREANKQGHAIAALNQPYDTYEAAVHRQHKRIAKMILTVLGTYCFCTMPQFTLSAIIRYHERRQVQKATLIYLLQIEKITVLIYWANTWLNPIIYAWKSKEFRVCFRKLLGLKPDNSIHQIPLNEQPNHAP